MPVRQAWGELTPLQRATIDKPAVRTAFWTRVQELSKARVDATTEEVPREQLEADDVAIATLISEARAGEIAAATA